MKDIKDLSNDELFAEISKTQGQIRKHANLLWGAGGVLVGMIIATLGLGVVYMNTQPDLSDLNVVGKGVYEITDYLPVTATLVQVAEEGYQDSVRYDVLEYSTRADSSVQYRVLIEKVGH